jgi:uncharacterized protein RhaS with RHS repeats
MSQNRDPIGEAGGFNLYQFVENNPISHVDKDGPISFDYRDWPIIAFLWDDENVEADEEGRNGDDNYRHCLASCRAARRAGPVGGALAIELFWNRRQEYPRFGTIDEQDSRQDIAANWDGYRKAWNIFQSCRERCRKCPRR